MPLCIAEKTNDEVKEEMENLLKESLLKITGKIEEDKKAYKEKLEGIIAQYKETNKEFLTKYYQSKIEWVNLVIQTLY